MLLTISEIGISEKTNENKNKNNNYYTVLQEVSILTSPLIILIENLLNDNTHYR